MKARRNQDVVRFIQGLSPADAFLSVLTLGELRKGVAFRARRDPFTAHATSVWIDTLEESFKERILPVDQPVARIWGELSADRSRPVVDTLLAATAIHHRLTLVTRNVRDMQGTTVSLLSPWMAGS